LHIMGAIWWAVTMGSLAGILAGMTLSHTSNRFADWGIGIGSGIVIGVMLGDFQQPTLPAIAVALTPAIVTAIAWGITMITTYRGTGIASQTRKPNLLIFSAGMALGIITGHLPGGGWAIILFPLCYIISYCQLPLSLLSFFSIKTAARIADEASDKQPSEVFVQLRASSVYWDEWEVLPVPEPRLGLYDMMELATEQDIEQATNILTFIEAERPLQFTTAQSGAGKGFLKLIADDKVTLKTQGDISEVAQQFTRLQALVIKLDIADSPEWLALLEEMLRDMMESTVLEQDTEQVVGAWSLINIQSSSSLAAAQLGLRRGFFRLIAREMEPRLTLRDFSETTPQFVRLQAFSTQLNISGLDEAIADLDEVFALLNDVCLDATHYLNSLGWQARHDALQDIITNLRKSRMFAYMHMPMPTKIPYRGRAVRLASNQPSEIAHWESEINRWEGTAQHELDKLQQEQRKTDQINNPYVVGQALQPGTSLFVGRQDLVQQLEQGLGRGSHRPTFFLNGERRMGKSTTLRQLPYLLDARHFLPIFFDLQAPEMTSNAAAFLGTIAEKMGETIRIAGMQVEPLINKHLQEAQRENEAAVYYAFKG
jgi:hypothetical protein